LLPNGVLVFTISSIFSLAEGSYVIGLTSEEVGVGIVCVTEVFSSGRKNEKRAIVKTKSARSAAIATKMYCDLFIT
jgi:hypothetical protein